jgi:streptogramin lyase
MTSGGISKWDRKTDTIMRWRIPIVRGFMYGLTIDSKGKLWGPNDQSGGVIRFDPETEEFTYFRLTEQLPARVRRPAVDSKDMIWVGDWASPNRRQANGRDKGGSLHRLNPKTDDNIWVANDNYISKYDQKADTFTHYPAVRRSDTLKLNITRDGAIWFVNRNAAKFAGAGAVASTLYPDKDKIKTFAAHYFEGSDHNRHFNHSGPMPPKVTGSLKYAIHNQNEEEYEKWEEENRLPGTGYAD